MSSIPDFSGVELGRPAAGGGPDDWAKRFEEVTGRSPADAVWLPLGQHEPRRRLIDLAGPQAWQPAPSWVVGS